MTRLILAQPIRSLADWSRSHTALKAFHLTTDAQKVAHWKAMDASRRTWISRMRDVVTDHFAAERSIMRDAVAGAVTVGSIDDRVEQVLAGQTSSLAVMLKRIYLAVGEAFGQRILDSLKSDGPSSHKLDVLRGVVLDWLALESSKKVKNVTDTTLSQIRGALGTGIVEGESIDQLADRMDDLYLESIIPHRSTVIARTEVIAASNLGSRAGAIETGLPLRHSWLSTRDARTREEHADADGQSQPMDEPYEVMGERLLFPGDSSMGASAGNVVQCRCAETYEIAA